MKILSITAGAAGMYCGSCLRDNALAVELLARGHDVTLLPLYTPTRPDEPNVSRDRVLFGGISVYLQQYVALFRQDAALPRSAVGLAGGHRRVRQPVDLDRSEAARRPDDLDARRASAACCARSSRSCSTGWRDEPVPDVVNLPNSLLIAWPAPLREALKRPVCCTLQGEELFLDGLVEPYRSRAIELIRAAGRPTSIASSPSATTTCRVMAKLLAIPRERIAVVPLGINLTGYERGGRAASGDVFRIGYFARIAPEKGLHVLAEAYVAASAAAPATRRSGSRRPAISRRARRRISTDVQATARRSAGLGGEFTYRGAVDRDGKLAFLQTLDVLSVPATYDEPKGMFLLEAMASGVPVVQPRRGAFTEIVEKTGGGLLVAPDDPDGARRRRCTRCGRTAALARRARRARRSTACARTTAIAHSADRLLEVYAARSTAGASRASRWR